MKHDSPAYAFCEDMAELKVKGDLLAYFQKWNAFVADIKAKGRPIRFGVMQAFVDTVDGIIKLKKGLKRDENKGPIRRRKV